MIIKNLVYSFATLGGKNRELSQSAQATIRKYYRLCGLNSRIFFFFSVLETDKTKIKVSANLISGGLYLTCRYCPHGEQGVADGGSFLYGLIRTLIYGISAPLMTSLKFNYLHKDPISNSNHIGGWTSTYEFWGDVNIQSITSILSEGM